MHGARLDPSSEVNKPAAPRSREAGPLPAEGIGIPCGHPEGRIAAVIGGPHDDRVVGEPEVVQRVQDLAGEGIHLDQQVGEISALRLAREFGVGDRRDVYLGVGQIHVERLALLLRPGHEVDRPRGDLAIEPCAEVSVVGGDDLGLVALLPRVDRLRREWDLGLASIGRGGHGALREIRLHRPHDFVGGSRAPDSLVEAEVHRAAAIRIAAEVPLPPHPRGVPGVRQRLRARHFPAREAVRSAGDRNRLGAATDRMTPGQQRRTARRALRLDVEVQEPQTLGGEPVDPRGRRTAEDPAAIATDLTPSEVVPEEDDDVRLLGADAIFFASFAAVRSSSAASVALGHGHEVEAPDTIGKGPADHCGELPTRRPRKPTSTLGEVERCAA